MKKNSTSLKINPQSARDLSIRKCEETDRISVVFSSETPVLEKDMQGRPYYVIFDHAIENIDRSAMIAGNRLSFLESHMSEPMVVLGSVTDITFPQEPPPGERVGRGYLEFSDTQRGQDAEKDFRGGHRQHLSVGALKIFPPLDVTIEEGTGIPILRVKWRPDEVSGVHRPGDPNVGTFRSASDEGNKIIEIPIPSTRGNKEMSLTPEQIKKKEEALAAKEKELALKEESIRAAKKQPGDDDTAARIKVELDKATIRAEQHKQVDGLVAMAVKSMGVNFDDIQAESERVKAEGVDPAHFRGFIMKLVSDRQAVEAEKNKLGLTPGEQKRFSIAKALIAMQEGDFTKDSKRASFEYRVSQEAEKLQPSSINTQSTGPHGLTMPIDIVNSYARRAELTAADLQCIATMLRTDRSMSVDQATKGGAFTAEGMSQSRFIDFLNAATISDQINLTRIPGLVNDLTFGVLDGIQEAYTRGEHEAATLSDLTTNSRKMSPRLLSSGTKISHLLKIQGAPMGIEALIERKLALAQAIKRNKLLIYGTGKNGEPLGIANNSAINVVSGGTNGAVPSLDNYINMRTLVAAANAATLPGQPMVFLMNSVTVGKNKRTKIETGQTDRVMAVNTPPGQVESCIGTRVVESNLLRSNLAKGTGTDLSEVIYLNPMEVYDARWGSMRVVVDASTSASTDETITYIHEYLDYMLGHAVAVSYMNDIITT